MCARRGCPIVLSVAFCALVCCAAEGERPPLSVVLTKPGDVAAVTEEAGRTVIVVTSESGIGRMTISARGRWPKDVTLRLRYRGDHPFKTLEGFEMTSSRLQIRSNSGQSGKVPFFLAGDDGTFPRNDLEPSGWLRMEFKPNDKMLEIQFPANLWRDEKDVHVQWIDFYRV